MGVGDGFDVYSGLPIYYTLLKLGKKVHLASYSSTNFETIKQFAEPKELNPQIFGANAKIKASCSHYPEGYLSKWLKKNMGVDKTVWMFKKTGPKTLKPAVEKLIENLEIDAVILVDTGVDSIMAGDEEGSGTMLEDTITLSAFKDIPNTIPKILMCSGMGTEVEENVCNLNALLNISILTKLNGFYGSCSLVNYMKSFQFYKSACDYVFSQNGHSVSNNCTRIISATEGEFGNIHTYNTENQPQIMVSPIMSICWFFNADAVIYRNKIIPHIQEIEDFDDCVQEAIPRIRYNNIVPRASIPY